MNRFKSIQYTGLVVLLLLLFALMTTPKAYGEKCPAYYITGFQEVSFNTNRVPDGDKPLDLESLDLPFPKWDADTALVVLSKYALSFGEMYNIQQLSDGTTDFQVGNTDHHLDVEEVSVSLSKFANKQARIHLRIWLRDKDGKDKWYGIVKAQIIFLKCYPAPSVPTPPSTGIIDTLRVRVDSLFQMLNRR
jgi:hypothetical protein